MPASAMSPDAAGARRSSSSRQQQQQQQGQQQGAAAAARVDLASSVDAAVAPPLVSQPYRLSLRARDAYGNFVYFGGASVDVKVIEPPIEAGSEYDHILAAKLECAVVDNLTGTYAIDLTCAMPGLHVVTVRLDGVEVIGSPLSIVASKQRVLASVKAAGKSRGETLYAVGAAIANAGANWAFKLWSELAYERQDKLTVLLRVASSLLNADVRACFATWYDNGQAYKATRASLERVLRSVKKQIVRRGWNSWVSYADDRRYHVDLLASTVATIKGHALMIGFNTWFEVLYPQNAVARRMAEAPSASPRAQAPRPRAAHRSPRVGARRRRLGRRRRLRLGRRVWRERGGRGGGGGGARRPQLCRHRLPRARRGNSGAQA